MRFAWRMGLAILAMCLPTLGHTRAGDFDTSFGSGGSVTFSQPGTLEAVGLALTADDRPVVVATYRTSSDTITRFLLARFTTTGQLDTTFGNGAGFVVTPLGNVDGEPRAIEIDRHGRIVVAGYQFNFGKKVPLILRYLANGTRDPSFGNNGGAAFELDTAGQEATAITLDSEDRIVAVTAGGNNFVFRLTATGALDESFGLGGATSISAGISSLAFKGVVHDSAGRIVLAGDVFDLRTSAFPQFLALRLASNGQIDTGYGSQGRATYGFSRRAEDRGVGIAALGDGVVLAGFATDAALVRNPAVVNFTNTGIANEAFGARGGSAVDVNSRDAEPRAIAVDPLGRIYAATEANDSNRQAQQVLLRWTRHGILDNTFATGGIFQSSAQIGQPITARGVRVDRFGRPILLGGRILGESLTVTRLKVDRDADSDGDGLPNELELAEGTNPLSRDHQVFGADANSLRRFSAQQYRDFLATEGDSSGIVFWTSRLQSGVSRAQVAEQFFQSGIARGGAVIRLYRGILGRNPDAEGLRFWLTSLGNGLTLNDFAEAMVQSPEFAARTGSLTDTAYVQSLYETFLGRAGDDRGVSYWVSELAQRRITRGALAASFSESSESIARTRHSVAASFAYLAVLGRAPDAGGELFWATQLASGASLTAFIAAMQGTSEYRARFVAP